MTKKDIETCKIFAEKVINTIVNQQLIKFLAEGKPIMKEEETLTNT